MTSILFLGASVSQVGAMRKARELGIRVVAVDGDSDAIGFADADVAEHVDFSDIERVIDVAERNRVSGVVAISTDRAVPVAAGVAQALGLPGIGVHTAELMTNKAAMRARLAEAEVPQPSFAILHDSDDLSAALARVGTPAVLKPVDSGGQRGVFRIDDLSALRAAYPVALSYSKSRTLILERYIEGSELNGIAVVSRGEPHLLTLSDRLRPAGPGFGVGWVHLYPSTLDQSVLDRVAENAIAAIRALGLRDGIAFPQILATPGEAYVVEVAARIPAGQMADLVRLGTGADLVEIAFRQALGRPIHEPGSLARFERPLAIRFLTASPGVLPTGRVQAVSGLDEVRSSEGVLDAGLYITVGETIKAVHVDQDRRGYVIATGRNPKHALALADAAALKLRVSVDAA